MSDKPCILTGYDSKYEAFAPYWLHCVRTRGNVDWPIYVCDFGFSTEHRNWLESEGVHVYKSASSETGWFLKPFAIRDCPARFGVKTDIDCEVMLGLDGFKDWIIPGFASIASDPNDVHYYKVDNPLNSGVICFDNQAKPISDWCREIEFRGEWSFDRDRLIRDRKGDQGVLNVMVSQAQIRTLPRKFNWFEKINDIDVEPDPEAVIWHHLGPVGKTRFLLRAMTWKEGIRKSGDFQWED